VLIRTLARKLLGVPESASYVPIRTPARKLFGAPESASYVPIRTPERKLFGAPELASYVPIRTPTRKLFGALLYAIPKENRGQQFDEIVIHDGQYDSSENGGASRVH